MRMIRAEWAEPYLVGNEDNGFVCQVGDLEAWEREIPCDKSCWKASRYLCSGPCIEYEKWLGGKPFEEKIKAKKKKETRRRYQIFCSMENQSRSEKKGC